MIVRGKAHGLSTAKCPPSTGETEEMIYEGSKTDKSHVQRGAEAGDRGDCDSIRGPVPEAKPCSVGSASDCYEVKVVKLQCIKLQNIKTNQQTGS